jgi:hypothetical protein
MYAAIGGSIHKKAVTLRPMGAAEQMIRHSHAPAGPFLRVHHTERSLLTLHRDQPPTANCQRVLSNASASSALPSERGDGKRPRLIAVASQTLCFGPEFAQALRY